MHLALRTDSGKHIVALTIKEAIFSIIVVTVIIWAAMTQGEPLSMALDHVKVVFSQEKDSSGLTIQKVVIVLLFLASLFSICIFVKKLFSALSNIHDHRRTNRGKNINDLIAKKITSELAGCHLASSTDINDGCVSAKADEEKLVRAVKEGLLNNEHAYISDWHHYEGNSDALSQIREMPINTSEFKSLRIELRNELKQKCLRISGDEQIKIFFHVASVQPSILLAIMKIIKECGISDIVRLVSTVSTGPETVKQTIEIAKNATEEANKITLFAAPLSAFVMADSTDEANAPKSYFYPVCNLIDEQQEILVVENGKKAPIRKGYIHYYDNSTAEEHMVNIYGSANSHVEFVPVNDYLNYKNILNGGGDLTDHIQPGDGIVVWPPLTDYYNGRDISGGYFVNNAVEHTAPTNSKIFLYCEKAVLDSYKEDKYALSMIFIRVLLLELRYIKNESQSRNLVKRIRSWIWQWRHLTDYTEEFEKLV